MMDRRLLVPGLYAAAGLLAGCAGPVNKTPDTQTTVPRPIAPGQVAEACFESASGDVVVYRFEADGALQFNMHYHVEGDVYYPVPEHMTAAEKAQYLVPARQTYCLMWANRSTAAIGLTVDIEGAGSITWY